MTEKTLRSTLIALFAALLAVGCQSNPNQPDTDYASGGTGGSSIAASDSDDADRTRVEGAVFGALIGGLLGAAIGDDARGAAIGAVVGAGAGYLIGDEIAKRKQQYAREEDFLDSEIALAREYNASTASYNDRLRADIARLDRRTRLLESRYRAGLASKSELESERRNLQQQIDSANKVHESVKREYEIKVAVLDEQQRKRGADSPYVRQLEREIVELKGNMDRLETQSVQLAQLDDRLTF